MAYLEIYSEQGEKKQELKGFEEIKSALQKANIDLELWQTQNSVDKEASQEEIISLYQKDIERIKEKHGFKSVDVINMNSSITAEKIKELRDKFLTEHTHSDDEVRFFIEGQGLFFVHHGDEVFKILCSAGDFIAVPAMTKHWFDMGGKPDFKCIRFFSEESGWVADYTGDKIAEILMSLHL